MKFEPQGSFKNRLIYAGCCCMHVFFLRKWFIRNQYSAAQKVKKVQYWITEI